MTLHNGMKIAGSKDGVKFTGYILELHKGISTILLDRPIGDSSSDRLYMGIDYETGKTTCTDHYHDRTDHVRSIPDLPGSEYELLQPTDYTMDFIRKSHRADSLAIYTASVERRLTTYKTVKKTVTCEYGHKHTIDERQPVKPKINQIHLNIAYFFYTLAKWAEMLQEIEYQSRQQTWHNLAGKLALCKWGQYADYTGLDPVSVKAHKQALKQIYEDTCTRALIAIFGTTGPYLNRYLNNNRTVYGPDTRANVEKILGGKITVEGLVK